VHEIVARIESALDEAAEALTRFTPGVIDSVVKSGGDPVTEADIAVNAALERSLPDSDEGWLSEETADESDRLGRRRIWVVDPIDGTREFIQGIPEWCVSVGLVEDGRPIAGGILNPATRHRLVGKLNEGLTLNGTPVRTSDREDLRGALVLASRSEVRRGEWDRFFGEPISIRNMGSVAYKLGLVAAGLADATWTLVPKHEWDVAAGAALVEAAGGSFFDLTGSAPGFNQTWPKLGGFVATAPGIENQVRELLDLPTTS
jgi:myo-inositol-1(or 4)-monophosphatase